MKELTNKLSAISFHLSEMANVHLEQLNGKCQEPDEVRDYFLGVMRRHAQITSDLGVILKNRHTENLTTPYILLRALLDDFIHMLYLDTSATMEDDIVRINAAAHNENFKSLQKLTDSENQAYHGTNFGYLSQEEMQSLKDTFKGFAKNQKYFDDINNFRFKRFKTLADVAITINHTENYNVARDRAFAYWKNFSGFVHYSNWCLDYELTYDELKIQHMDEALQYVFNTIYIAAYHLRRLENISIKVDTFLLKEIKYPIIKRDPS